MGSHKLGHSPRGHESQAAVHRVTKSQATVHRFTRVGPRGHRPQGHERPAQLTWQHTPPCVP